MEKDDVFESFFEEAVQKEIAQNEFKDAHTHNLKRRCAEYYASQKRKWEGFKEFSYGFNPIEKFTDIPVVCSISLYSEYVVVGPAEKEGVKHTYSDVINLLLSYINRNLIHPYLLDLLDRGEYPFYDNHIVVEVVDYRQGEPVTSRVLLRGSIGGMPYTHGVLLSTKTEEAAEAEIYAKTASICLDPSPEVFEVMKNHDYNVKKYDRMRIDKKQKTRVQISGVIKEYRRAETVKKNEAYLGLERAINPRIYRTAKFIGGSIHYSINAIANTDYIEVVFRKGSTINTASGGFIARRKFTSPGQIDLYIDSTKKLLEMYHTDLKCICDISATPRKNKYYSPLQYQRQHTEDTDRRMYMGRPSSQMGMPMPMERHMRYMKPEPEEPHSTMGAIVNSMNSIGNSMSSVIGSNGMSGMGNGMSSMGNSMSSLGNITNMGNMSNNMANSGNMSNMSNSMSNMNSMSSMSSSGMSSMSSSGMGSGMGNMTNSGNMPGNLPNNMPGMGNMNNPGNMPGNMPNNLSGASGMRQSGSKEMDDFNFDYINKKFI